MDLKEIEIAGRTCYIGCSAQSEFLLVQPVDEHDMEGLDREIEVIEEKTDIPFGFAAFRVNRWNDDLSPWEAPPVFGDRPFGSGAADTLAYIENDLVPAACAQLGLPRNIKIIVGGYSLSAFFALWCMTESDRIAGVAAASPSVWFPGWIEHLRNWTKSAAALVPVYLSLGDREPKAGSPLMRTVGDRIEETRDILAERAGSKIILEWNKGNHFKEPDVRTGKGFAAVLNMCSGL